MKRVCIASAYLILLSSATSVTAHQAVMLPQNTGRHPLLHDFVGLWTGQFPQTHPNEIFYENLSINGDGTVIDTFFNSVMPATSPKPMTSRHFWKINKGNLIITSKRYDKPTDDFPDWRMGQLAADKTILTLWWEDDNQHTLKFHRVKELPDLNKIKPRLVSPIPSPVYHQRKSYNIHNKP